MGKRHFVLTVVMAAALLVAGAGCNSNTASPGELLEKYFSSAVNQDYAVTYTCYYDAYKAKINKEDFIKHRKEASVLQSYKIVSLKQDGDAARAEVVLTFAPSEKLKRSEPVSTTVKEDLVKEGGQWKIKVW